MPDSNTPNDAALAGGPGGLRAGMRVVGRYELLRELGRGGMGVVWLATDHTLQRQVAFKVLPDALREDRTALVDLRDETRRNLEITHPHIVRIYDFEEDAGLAGITMEFVDGETLAAKKVNRPQRVFDPLELVPWIRQLCEALYYAHTDPRVVHRDLKPANLMVNARGQLKITDFGIARSINDSFSRVTNSQVTSGTLVYMSPQQLMGSSSAADDIYSVGATLYDLITSKPPFYSGNISAQVLQVVAPSMAERRAQLGRQGGVIPPVFEEVVAACLAKEPEGRPLSALAIIERIEAGLGTSRHAISITPPLPATAQVPVPPPPPPPPQPATAPQSLPLVVPPPPPTMPATAGSYTVVTAPAPSRGPWVLVAMLVCFGLLALAGAVYFGMRGPWASSNSSTPAPTGPGRVIVNTVPDGARITLDGKDAGVSPMTIEDVSAGDHRVRIEANGYQPVELRVSVTSGKTVHNMVPLVPARAPDPATRPTAETTSASTTPASTKPEPLPTFNSPPPPQPAALTAEAVRGFVMNYLTAYANGDEASIASYFTNPARYYDEGTRSSADIRGLFRRDRLKWSVYRITLLSAIDVGQSGDANVVRVNYKFRYDVGKNQGTVIDTMEIQQTPRGMAIRAISQRKL